MVNKRRKRNPFSIVASDDLLITVFSWLPLKSLFRFRCLSKKWLDIISNDQFFIQLQYSNQSKSKPPVLSFMSCPEFPIFGNRYQTRYILQSSLDMEGNLLGKFVMRSSKKGYPCYNMLRTRFDLVCYESCSGLLVICNPRTEELVTLQPSVSSFEGHGSYGFGYVKSTCEYKIVHLVRLYLDSSTQCRVFTLGMATDSVSSSSYTWKRVENSPYHVVNSEGPAFVDEALHWFIKNQERILAFNVKNEEFKLIPYPNLCHHILELVELGGFLSISCTVGDQMEIWMLKDYKNVLWVKEYSIDVSTLDDLYPSRFGLYTPVYIHEDGDGNIKVLIETWGEGKLFYYHCQTSSFSGSLHVKERFSYCSLFIESLRSLKHVLQGNPQSDIITRLTRPNLRMTNQPTYGTVLNREVSNVETSSPHRNGLRRSARIRMKHNKQN